MINWEEEFEELYADDPEFHESYDVAEKRCISRLVKENWDSRYITLYLEGFRQGFLGEMIDIVKQLIGKGLTSEEIADLCDWPLKRINRIRETYVAEAETLKQENQV